MNGVDTSRRVGAVRRGFVAAIFVLVLTAPFLGPWAEETAKPAPAAPAAATNPPVDELAGALDRETRQYLAFAQDQARQEAEALRTLKGEVMESVQKLEAIRAEMSQRYKTEDAARAQKVQELVKIYETMQPEAIAKVVEHLDGELKYQVLARLKKKTLSRILAEMPAEQAAATSKRLLETRIPDDKGSGAKTK